MFAGLKLLGRGGRPAAAEQPKAKSATPDRSSSDGNASQRDKSQTPARAGAALSASQNKGRPAARATRSTASTLVEVDEDPADEEESSQETQPKSLHSAQENQPEGSPARPVNPYQSQFAASSHSGTSSSQDTLEQRKAALRAPVEASIRAPLPKSPKKATPQKTYKGRGKTVPTPRTEEPGPEPEEELFQPESEPEEEEEPVAKAPAKRVSATKSTESRKRKSVTKPVASSTRGNKWDTLDVEPQHVQVQLLPWARSKTPGEVLDVRVGDSFIIRGETGHRTGKAKSSKITYKEEKDDLYWIGTVRKIRRSDMGDWTDGELDNDAALEIRWWLTWQEINTYGINDPLIQDEKGYMGNKEVFWSDWIQNKPEIPIESLCGKCSITKFRDTAPTGQASIQLWEEEAETYSAAPAGHAIEAGAGRWSQTTGEHFFFHRMKIKGLGLNWKNMDTKSWSEANLSKARTAYKYRLRRPCNCAEPYNPDTIMRHCASEECNNGKEGTWYHMSCLKEQQAGLTRNSKMNPIANFPTKKPAKVDRGLWEMAKQKVVRGGPYGLVGNWPVVDAARTMILRHRAGEQEFQDLQNWEDFEEVEFNAWREADEEGVDRFAGNEDDHQIEILRKKEDPDADLQLLCPKCRVHI